MAMIYFGHKLKVNVKNFIQRGGVRQAAQRSANDEDWRFVEVFDTIVLAQTKTELLTTAVRDGKLREIFRKPILPC